MAGLFFGNTGPGSVLQADYFRAYQFSAQPLNLHTPYLAGQPDVTKVLQRCSFLLPFCIVWRALVPVRQSDGLQYLSASLAVCCTCLLVWRSVVPVCQSGGRQYLSSSLAVCCTCLLVWRAIVPVCQSGGLLYLSASLAVCCTCLLVWRAGWSHRWCASESAVAELVTTDRWKQRMNYRGPGFLAVV